MNAILPSVRYSAALGIAYQIRDDIADFNNRQRHRRLPSQLVLFPGLANRAGEDQPVPGASLAAGKSGLSSKPSRRALQETRG